MTGRRGPLEPGRGARRSVAAAVLTLVLVGALGACTSAAPTTAATAGTPGSASPTAGPSAAPSSVVVEPSSTPDPTPTGPPPDFSTAEPTTPDEAAGQAYLRGRVPDGMDPNAVLEAGVEACDRMRYLATVDEDALVEALTAGSESTDWPAAIEYLCPDLADYAAQAGVAD